VTIGILSDKTGEVIFNKFFSMNLAASQLALLSLALSAEAATAPSTKSVPVPASAVPAPSPQLGTNLTAVVDYTREWPFVNAFKVARPWISQGQGLPFGEGAPLTLRPDGYPAYFLAGQYAETLIYDNNVGSAADYPTGNYTLYYDGEGTISFDDSSATIVSQTSGKMVVNVPSATNGIYLKLTYTNPASPLHNIRLVTPGYEDMGSNIVFHPTFLLRLKGYVAFRFMEWMQTNTSTQVNWTDRPLVTDYTWTKKGVPLEVMIALANQTGASPWFNIPHAATDDYVLNFAAMVKAKLNPSIKFYIEYSNETWNTQFSQAAYVEQQGLAHGFSTNQYTAGADYTAYRSVQIFNIFQTVFGGTSRFTRVIASQAANPGLQEMTIAYNNAYQNADALAIAPYFSDCSDSSIGGWGVLGSPATEVQVDALSVAQVLEAEQEHVSNCANAEMTAASAVARKYGLKLVGYEGGQSLVGTGAAATDATMANLFAEANRAAGMGTIYDSYLANWKSAGGDIFFHFSDVVAFNQYGNWGSLERQDQNPSTAPKYLSLMRYAAANNKALVK
jgi:hypothetical protein